MKYKFFTLLITVVCITPAKIHVGPVCTGIGSWISFNSDNPYYTSYNKLSSDVYLSYKGWSGFFGIPFQCVVSHRDETKYAFSPGDFNFYIGRRISFVQPLVWDWFFHCGIRQIKVYGLVQKMLF